MASLRNACEWRLDGDRLGGPKEPPGGPPQPPARRDDGNGEGEGRSGALTLTRTRTKKPSMYKVLMLNDHQKGVGVCGVYTYEIAETKVTQTVDYARKNQHPLQCTLEKE